MAKQEQILQINPLHELKFRGPFTVPVTSYMKLTNPSNHKVCFKIKTTAPKKYCVRPNSGILTPKDVIEIAVSLQPFEFDPNEKNKHKFMVQTMIAPDGEINLDQLWKDVTAENLMDSKLKCVFEMPVEENATSATAQETSSAVEENTKRVGDSPSVAHDGELVKAAKEVKHLREEESSLRQENLQLKEELMRLQSTQYKSASYPPPSSPSQVSHDSAYSPLLIITAIIMAIVGIVIGKYIL
ncbi:vesicle-associated membrane protein/synaptobrevin-binding protein [Macrosteles quadrilineatus]|uniref:vesicle-associated membrane protein/synaptobrevin-binding protein n=1 Tax=Macrosteles quadrilineatus TaxID=74068 RepID=UPI0023E1D1B8|nr:vesicle-associated membrane protein/synaptobrevin-binding protein [Macrosteles quadrilineatus]